MLKMYQTYKKGTFLEILQGYQQNDQSTLYSHVLIKNLLCSVSLQLRSYKPVFFTPL